MCCLWLLSIWIGFSNFGHLAALSALFDFWIFYFQDHSQQRCIWYLETEPFLVLWYSPSNGQTESYCNLGIRSAPSQDIFEKWLQRKWWSSAKSNRSMQSKKHKEVSVDLILTLCIQFFRPMLSLNDFSFGKLSQNSAVRSF